jgi:hypothetical protein
MRAQESFLFSNFTTTQGPFTLRGGRYVVTMKGTSGTLSLQVLAADGTTFVIAKDIAGNAVTNASLATATFFTVDLPPISAEFAGSSPVGAYASIVRVPEE